MMSEQNFIKQNLALIAGIALPVVIMAAFFVYALHSQVKHSPPQYSFLFQTHDYNRQGDPGLETTLFVRDKKLYVRHTKYEDINKRYKRVRLFYYDIEKEKTRELVIPSVGEADFVSTPSSSGEAVEKMLLDTEKMTIDTRIEAPDGYSFEKYSRYRGSFFLDVFGHSRSRRGLHLVKDHTRHKIKKPTHTSYYNIDFIGWIIP